MAKRLLLTLLWFFTGWYAGAMVAELTGLTEFLGPVVGAAFGAVYAGDPRGLWGTRRPMIRRAATAAAQPAD